MRQDSLSAADLYDPAMPAPVSFHVPFGAGRTDALGPDEDVYRGHGMDGWIINYTHEGRGCIGTDADAFTVTTGDLLLFRPLVKHEYGCDPEAGRWVHLWAYFFPRPVWHDLLAWPETAGGVCRLAAGPGDLRTRVVQLFEHIIQVSRSPLRRREAFAMSALESLLLWCDTVNPRSRDAGFDKRIQRALTLLCDRHQEQISIERLARWCDLSSSRLSHLFRAEVGMTPLRYLERHRIAKASDLLLMTGKPVSEVAREVGFRSPLYFARIFKRATRQTPSDFRRNPRRAPVILPKPRAPRTGEPG